jgi:hypothetical protein
MSDGVLAALIGLFGTVVAAVIGLFNENLRARILGRPKTDGDLLGYWECKWEVTIPEDGSPIKKKKKFPIDDTVEFEKISAERIRAKGRTSGVGEYRLDGRISISSLVTFFYEGIGSTRQPLGGVVILALNRSRNKLTGYWYEFDEDGKIIGGKTMWTKPDRGGSSPDGMH